LNLGLIEALFEAGETVNLETLREKGLAPRMVPGGLKVLANGTLTKKVTIEAHRFSAAAREKLDKAGIAYTEITINS
jgi:large subunit ribosomal protein L15